MRYLIDTDWTANFLNGMPEVVSELQSRSQQGLAISLITYGEISDGIYDSNDPSAAEQRFR